MINSLLMYCLLPELKRALKNGRVSQVKITLDKKSLLLFIKKQNKEICLLLSTHPQNCRAELLTPKEAREIETLSASIFSSLNRAILQETGQLDFDRVINFYFIRKIQFGKTKKYRLVAELTGRNSNLILVDGHNEKILDFLRGAKTAHSRYREIRTGIKYTPPPPPKKLNPLITNQGELKELLLHNNQTSGLEFLTNRFNSIDSLTAQKIAYPAKVNLQKKIQDLSPLEIDNLSKSFIFIFNEAIKLKLNPQVIFNQQGIPTAISIFSLPFVPENQKKSYPNLNQAIKTFFGIKQRGADRVDLHKIVSKQIAKLKVRQQKLQQDLAKATRYEEFKKIGDLLIANAHRLKRGKDRVKLTDFFDEKRKDIIIPLDPSLGPIENAKNYFKKFKKGKVAVKIIENRSKETNQEKGRLTSLLHKLEKGLSADELSKIESGLKNMGYLPRTKGKSEKSNGKLPPRQFLTSDGFRVLVGRNNKENDYITFRVAKKDDLWFHVDKFAGSHVLLLRDDKDKEFNRDTISQAASLAAYFSKARNSKKVSVIYTLVKYVRKPKGAKPGLVTVNREKSVVVEPKLLK